jgi:cell division protein FtsI (penicillin-binding protein 3)
MLCNELGISNHSQTEEEWVKSSVAGTGVNWKKTVNGREITPDVMGMTFRDAIYLLENSGLRVSYEGKGRVIKQSLNPGAKVHKGSTIFIRLG